MRVKWREWSIMNAVMLKSGIIVQSQFGQKYFSRMLFVIQIQFISYLIHSALQLFVVLFRQWSLINCVQNGFLLINDSGYSSIGFGLLNRRIFILLGVYLSKNAVCQLLRILNRTKFTISASIFFLLKDCLCAIYLISFFNFYKVSLF